MGIVFTHLEVHSYKSAKSELLTSLTSLVQIFSSQLFPGHAKTVSEKKNSRSFQEKRKPRERLKMETLLQFQDVARETSNRKHAKLFVLYDPRL